MTNKKEKLTGVLNRFIPKSLHLAKLRFNLRRFKNKSAEEVFSTIYRENIWGGAKGEYCSGAGTLSENAAKYVEVLVNFIVKNQVKSVLEIGCGDFRIMNHVLARSQGVEYLGTDVVPDLIQRNQKTFGAPGTKFAALDAITGTLPQADLILIRQVFQHLSNKQIISILNKIPKSCKYALVTEHLYAGKDVVFNLDKEMGPDIRIYRCSGVFLDKPPFEIPRLETLLEYREDVMAFHKLTNCVMRTSIIRGQL